MTDGLQRDAAGEGQARRPPLPDRRDRGDRRSRRLGGALTDAAEVAALDFCYVTTTGRRTRYPHTIEIWFALDGRTLYLLAGSGDASDWVRNIRADGTVGLRLGDEDYIARARVVEDPDEDRRARDLVYAKYAPRNDDLEEWRERALPVAIDLPPTGR